MERKYELTNESMEFEGHTLHRIKALVDFSGFTRATLGGWIESILKTYTNTEIIVVENKLLTPEEEVVQDLITIIHVFSSRVYGLRKYSKKIKKELDK